MSQRMWPCIERQFTIASSGRMSSWNSADCHRDVATDLQATSLRIRKATGQESGLDRRVAGTA
jgi:hypothetical protein